MKGLNSGKKEIGMKKNRVNNWTEPLKAFFISVFLILILLYICTYIVITHFWIGERTDNLENKFLDSACICDVYDLNLTEDDMIYRMERHSFRDSITYYTLYVKIKNMKKFVADNQEIISMFHVCNDSDYSKRPTLYPCIHYEGNTIVIVTSDIRNNTINESNDEYKIIYSDRVAEYFDSCYIQE